MKMYFTCLFLASMLLVKCSSNSNTVVAFTEKKTVSPVLPDSITLLSETNNFLFKSGKIAFDIIGISGLQKMDSYSTTFDEVIKFFRPESGEMLFEIKSSILKKIRDGQGSLCDFIIDEQGIYVLFSSPAEIYEYNMSGDLIKNRRLHLPVGIEVHHESPAFYRIKQNSEQQSNAWIAPLKYHIMNTNDRDAKEAQFLVGIFDQNGRLLQKVGNYPDNCIGKELNFNGPDFVTCYQHPYLYILHSTSTTVEVFNLEKQAFSTFEIPPGHRRNYDLVNLNDTLLSGIQSITHGYKRIDKINDRILYFYQVPDSSIPGFRFNSIVTLLSLEDKSYYHFNLNEQGKTGFYLSSEQKDKIFYTIRTPMDENMILYSKSIVH